MADQIERLITAINNVNRSIQRTQTYKDANTHRFLSEEPAIVDVSGVSGLLAVFLKEITGLVGSLAGASSVIAAMMKVTRRLPGFSFGGSSANAALRATRRLDGFSFGGSSLSSILQRTRMILGQSAGASGLVASFDLQPGLVGSTVGASGLTGIPNRHLLAGSVASGSVVFGFLDK